VVERHHELAGRRRARLARRAAPFVVGAHERAFDAAAFVVEHATANLAALLQRHFERSAFACGGQRRAVVADGEELQRDRG